MMPCLDDGTEQYVTQHMWLTVNTDAFPCWGAHSDLLQYIYWQNKGFCR